MRGLAARDVRGCLALFERSHWHLSPLRGALLVAAPALHSNLHACAAVVDAPNWRALASASPTVALVGALFHRTAADEAPRATQLRSLPAAYLCARMLGHLAGLAAAGADATATEAALRAHCGVSELASRTGVTIARFVRLGELVRDAMHEPDGPACRALGRAPGAAVLTRLLWERAHSRACLARYAQGVGAHAPEALSPLGAAVAQGTGGAYDAWVRAEAPPCAEHDAAAAALERRARRLVERVGSAPLVPHGRYGLAGGPPRGDCVEVVVRELLQFGLHNADTGRYDCARLPPGADPRLVRFFDERSAQTGVAGARAAAAESLTREPAARGASAGEGSARARARRAVPELGEPGDAAAPHAMPTSMRAAASAPAPPPAPHPDCADSSGGAEPSAPRSAGAGTDDERGGARGREWFELLSARPEGRYLSGGGGGAPYELAPDMSNVVHVTAGLLGLRQLVGSGGGLRGAAARSLSRGLGAGTAHADEAGVCALVDAWRGATPRAPPLRAWSRALAAPPQEIATFVLEASGRADADAERGARADGSARAARARPRQPAVGEAAADANAAAAEGVDAPVDLGSLEIVLRPTSNHAFARRLPPPLSAAQLRAREALSRALRDGCLPLGAEARWALGALADGGLLLAQPQPRARSGAHGWPTTAGGARDADVAHATRTHAPSAAELAAAVLCADVVHPYARLRALRAACAAPAEHTAALVPWLLDGLPTEASAALSGSAARALSPTGWVPAHAAVTDAVLRRPLLAAVVALLRRDRDLARRAFAAAARSDGRGTLGAIALFASALGEAWAEAEGSPLPGGPSAASEAPPSSA